MIAAGVNGLAKEVKNIYAGVGGKAKKIVNGWIGVGGKAERIYSEGKPYLALKINGDTASFDVSGINLSVDWGDGTKEDLTGQTSFYHSYAVSGEFTVILSGRFSYLSFRNRTNLTEVLTPIPKNQLGSLDECFSGCTALTSIPNGLFDNCTAATNFNSCFQNCTSLTTIPSGLFDNCTAVTDFAGCFYGCESLTTIPSGLFDNCTAVTGFSSCFDDCAAITSAVPELWDATKWPNVESHDFCFRDCTNAANYADIPSGWK